MVGGDAVVEQGNARAGAGGPKPPPVLIARQSEAEEELPVVAAVSQVVKAPRLDVSLGPRHRGAEDSIQPGDPRTA